jgi:signal transduction histidine kinase
MPQKQLFVWQRHLLPKRDGQMEAIMSLSADAANIEELRRENTLLHDELKTARKASEVKNALVVEQFRKIDAMLKQLEQEAAKEQKLRQQLEVELGISEERKRELDKARTAAEESLAALKQTQKHLVESEKMAALGGLVAGVAHEINTPVGVGITGVTYLQEKLNEVMAELKAGAMKRSSLDKFFQTSSETLEITMTNLTRAAELIASFKQVAVDQSSEDRRKFNFKNYVNDVLLSLKHQYKRTKHRIEVSGPDNVDVDSFPGAISQIVTNLLMNSLIHAYENDDAGRILFDIRSNDGSVVLSYSDDGKGIPPENLPRIFDPFFTTRRGKGGSGLGMNIVYNLVRNKLNGSITCDSEVGKGTTFIVSFPANIGV